jgi:hypothetical protein
MWQPGSLAARWLNSGVLRDSGVFAGFYAFFPFGTIFVYFAILGQACGAACR